MLANVLLLPDPAGATRRFDRIKVYFDTPLILRALGLEGPSLQDPSLELIDLLFAENIDLRIFDHTLNEVHRILDSAAKALRSDAGLRHAYGGTLEHLVDANYTASDVEMLIAKLPQSIRALHITAEPKPPHTDPLGLNETKLERVLQTAVGYRRQDALLHDLDALTAIHRLRKGRAHRHVESCEAIFVTTNLSLARASASFFTEEYEDVTVPLCILDSLLVTLIWLKRPLAIPDLPRKVIIAQCYAAMRPPDALWRRYLEEMTRLQAAGQISDEDYHLLRFSTEARTELVSLTFGSAGAFSGHTVREVLEAARAAVRAQAKAAIEAEIHAEIQGLDSAVLAETEKRKAAELRAAEVEQKIAARDLALGNRLRYLATSAASPVATIAFALLFLCLLLAGYATLPPPFPPLPSEWWRFVAPVAVALALILGLANLAVGTTLRGVSRRLESVIARLIERALRRLMGL